MQQQEAQVPPSVAEARQLRFAAARAVLDRDLADVELLLGCANDHLRGELHPARAQLQHLEAVAPERAHAAVRVAHPRVEEQVQEARQQRVADVAVMPGHRARVDVLHAVADDHVRAVAQAGQEAGDLLEVVCQVGVGHDDVLAVRRRETGAVGAAVAARRFVHHPRPRALGQLGAAVLRAVVGDDHLARDACAPRSHARAKTTHSSMFCASFRHGITTDSAQVAPPRATSTSTLSITVLIPDDYLDVRRGRQAVRPGRRAADLKRAGRRTRVSPTERETGGAGARLAVVASDHLQLAEEVVAEEQHDDRRAGHRRPTPPSPRTARTIAAPNSGTSPSR